MKKLGLIGGMGPESTIPYYHSIVYGVQQRTGQKLFPCLTIESVDVFEVLRFCREERYDELTAYLMKAIHNLEKSGADFAALSANTPHIVFDQLREQSSIPLISIVEAACQAARKRNFKRIGLLGTIFTMQGAFFKKPFVNQGIEVVIPSLTERQLVDLRISSELELGIKKEKTLEEFQAIIRRMKVEEKIEAVVLGCTELPLLLNDEVSPLPCLDTMEIHVQAIIDAILL